MHIPGFGGQPVVAVAQRAIRGFFDHNMLIYAAALSYHAMLALFPFLIFLLTLLGALGLADFFTWLLAESRAALPPDAYQIVSLVISEIRGQRRLDLLSFGFVFALLAASTGVRALMKSLAAAYAVRDRKPVWQPFVLSILYTVGLAVLLALVVGFMLLGPRASLVLATRVGQTETVSTIWNWLQWPLFVLILLLTIAIVYYLGSGVGQRFRLVTPGSVIAALVWILASFGFSIYAAHFGTFGATYGSLAGIIVLLIYFFVASAVLLFGAEVNAAILQSATEEHADICPPA